MPSGSIIAVTMAVAFLVLVVPMVYFTVVAIRDNNHSPPPLQQHET